MSDNPEPKFHRDKEGKIKLIIETFVRLINQKSYTNVSTNLVAKEAGLSIGTVYNYFKSKEDILQAAFQV
ncbi:MAG: TetR/AcrR family transcriptional regulator, partial [Candidatus Heimdallarchaeota archaeon]